jgi:hypothetical protein
MTELVSAEPIVTTIDYSALKEKIVRRKTIVHEVNMDLTMIRISGEKLKLQLFAKFGLFKPKSDEIQFLSSELYYEPYLVINGKYFIDYYRKCTYNVKVDQEVKEVVLLRKKFVPKNSSSNRRQKIITINSEERLTNEVKAFMVLDKNGKKAMIDKLQSAPSSKNPKSVIKKCKIKELPKNFEVNLMRNKIARRPRDLSRIIKEIFEVTERTVIYTPRFKLQFKNTKTNEEKILILDGVTSQKL